MNHRNTVLLGIIVSGFLLLLFGQCKHQPMEPITPVVNDTTSKLPKDTTTIVPFDSVCFNTQIYPLIMSNCGMSGCHDAASHAKGLNITTYANIAYYANQIKNSTANNNMPRGIPALTANQKAMFQKWIDQGKANVVCVDPCDTVNITFNSKIKPLIQNYCIGCHGTTSAVASGGSIFLNTYDAVKLQTQSGHLLCSVENTGTCSKMPKGLNKLSYCEMRKFRIWMNNNYPQ